MPKKLATKRPALKKLEVKKPIKKGATRADELLEEERESRDFNAGEIKEKEVEGAEISPDTFEDLLDAETDLGADVEEEAADWE